MTRDDRHWAMATGERRESRLATLRGVLALALPAALLGLVAATTTVRAALAVLETGLDWSALVELPMRSVLALVRVPLGEFLGVSLAVVLITGLVAAQLAAMAVDRARS